MNVYVNELIFNPINKKQFRILWLSENNKYAFVIDTHDTNALPIIKSVKELIDNILEGDLLKEKSDSNGLIEGYISDKAIADRDLAWDIIKDIVYKEPEIYFKEQRGKLVKELMLVHKISKPTLYKYLRRYWQRGKIPNALIPDFLNCGGKGKEKQPKRKMGRPVKFKELESEVIRDEAIKKIFRVSLQSFYFNQKKNSLPFAHKMMVKKFYLKDTYYDNGKEKVVLKDKATIPTINQLRYFLKTEYTEKQKIIPRVGRIKYEQNYRELMGSSTFESFGPGSRFQIDATIADVYLVSEYNPDWIIGRPIVYFVVDIFSRSVVGMYVGLEGPSWLGAMMAIANTASDKQKFCAEYGIKITKEQWPCEHLPQQLLADRGEFEGYNVERLINVFNLDPENAAPYRPDWKGLIEKYFDVFQGRIKPFLPGYVEKDYKERGSRDYRLDAKLTIKDFTKIIIAEIIYHNNHHLIKNYPRDKEMIEDDVIPIPTQLWNWGVKHRSGKLTFHSIDKIKLNLMPHDVATVTEKGIRFKKMHYICDKAIKNSWFSTANIKGSWNVNIAYDPRNMTNIYLLSDNGAAYEVCTLLEYEERFMNMNKEDVEYLLQYEDLQTKRYEHTQLKEEINLINEIEETVSSAIKKADELQSENISNSKKVSDIRENRTVEKELLREKEYFQITPIEDEKAVKKELNQETIPTAENEYKRKSIKEILSQNTIGDQKHG